MIYDSLQKLTEQKTVVIPGNGLLRLLFVLYSLDLRWETLSAEWLICRLVGGSLHRLQILLRLHEVT